MKKLLFITTDRPYPAQSGGKVKSLKLLQSLAKRYQVTLACPLKRDDVRHVEDFHAMSPCFDHLHEEVEVPRTPANLAISYRRGVPLNVHRTRGTDLQARIAKVASRFDIVFLDHYEVFPYLPRGFEGLTVYHAHNAYFKMWARYAGLPGNPAMRAAAWLESIRVRRYEARVGRAVDLVFAAPNDARELIASGVPGGKIQDTYHLGDDRQLALPDLRFTDTREKLMYVGFLGWEPNVQGLLWFIEQVWPLAKARHPDLRFDIVGKDPDRRLQEAVTASDGIVLRGFVNDLQEIYRDSRVSVAPLLFGSGMKVKVLDAMARGMPTVTTSVGAEGIAVEHGRHLMVTDDPPAMADSIHTLLTDPELWERLQQHSRALVAERYTWRQLLNQMHRAIDLAMRSKGGMTEFCANQRLQHAG